MALKKKATVAKSADAARKGAMTATVVKKVSSNVKVLKPGSKPLTQTLTEKRAIMEKAKGKTPAARAQAAIEKKAKANRAKRNEAGNRNYAVREAGREALRASGYQYPKTGMGSGPDAAQKKAVNKAQAQAERDYKAALAKRKAAEKVERAAKAKAARGSVGGGGLRGGSLGGGGPFGKIR